jgi:integrase
MPRAPKYCIRKGHAFYGRLNIPADCRHAFGGKKKTFVVPLHESDPVRAAAKVMPLVMEWKARIAAVRRGLHDPLRDQIDRLAAEFRKLNSPLDDRGARLVTDAIDFVFRQVGGMAAIEQRKALSDARGDVLQALQATPHAARAVNAARQIAGAEGARTPFLTHMEKWSATLRKSKTSAAWVSILSEFDQAVDQPLEQLSGRHVQTWIDDLLSAGKHPRTVRYKCGALIAYWKFMASREIVDGERNPFKSREVKSRQSAVERAKTSRVGFPPGDVPKLWRAAEASGDNDLAAAIKLAAFMGWRLEELSVLKATDVHRTAGIMYISGGMKTEAGLRSLPVPTAIRALVERLIKRRDSDGYLIRSMADNQWDQRGTPIGQRFSKLKTRLGYDRTRTFHSFRHTYATLLSHVPLAMLRDLMGHENGDVTLGYIDPSQLIERLHWLDKAIQFPEAAQTPITT